MSLKRTLPDDLTFKSHDVKMYPTEPFREGIAFIEYDVLNKALGDLETEMFKPRGIEKSRMAGANYRQI
jgi:hypothetical protein